MKPKHISTATDGLSGVLSPNKPDGDHSIKVPSTARFQCLSWPQSIPVSREYSGQRRILLRLPLLLFSPCFRTTFPRVGPTFSITNNLSGSDGSRTRLHRGKKP